jgi:hypothetical protein
MLVCVVRFSYEIFSAINSITNLSVDLVILNHSITLAKTNNDNGKHLLFSVLSSSSKVAKHLTIILWSFVGHGQPNINLSVTDVGFGRKVFIQNFQSNHFYNKPSCKFSYIKSLITLAKTNNDNGKLLPFFVLSYSSKVAKHLTIILWSFEGHG